jgi:hypothetical protein
MPKRRLKRHSVSQPLDASYRLIPLTQNQNAKVDAADYEWLNQWNWCADWNPCIKGFYALRVEKEKTITMHRFILDCKKGEEADHRNHDTLDNRRENLRRSSSSQNKWNRGPRKDCTSGFRGVWKARNKFYAAVYANKKRHYVGLFDDPVEAAKARDKVAKQLHGEFVHLNFPNV